MRRAALATVALCLVLAAPASAKAPSAWGPLAERIAEPWPGLQNENGTYQDYVYGGDVSFCLVRQCKPGLGNARYAEAVLGHALLQTGVRTGNGALIDTALRSLTWVAEHPEYRDTLQTNFETWALASSYNIAKRRLASRPLFRQNRRSWERWLTTVKPLLLRANARRYFNHHLVEAVAVFELKRTGLRSKTEGAVLHPGTYNSTERRAVRIVEDEVYAVARPTLLRSGGGVAALVSDRPEYPLAYQGLSIGFYARALEVMGSRLSARARQLLGRMVHASWLLTAPDGDLAYAGRSQEESWALTMTAYGAQVAARQRGVGGGTAARWQALADRAVERLRTEHDVGSQGLYIVPALGRDLQRGLPGLDPYAGAAIFSGLTLTFLEYAREEAAARTRTIGRLASDAQGPRLLGRADDSFVTLRTGSLWFAVRQSRDMQRRLDDLRSDFGMVALKRRVDGRWRDVIPLRPRVESPDRRAADSAGPRLRPGGGTPVGVPVGTAISAGRSSVRVVTGWRMPDGTMARPGTPVRYEAVSCGVRMRLPVAAGDAVEYDVLAVRDPDGVTVDGARVSDGLQEVTFSEAPSGVEMLPGYSSGSHPVITRVRATFPAGAARTLDVTTCGG
ncbi:MAG TPA: hypothetical protein VF715_08575 [Thermoleophilaceae bacterium]